MARVKVRTGMPDVQLDEGEFKEALWARFYDPIFEPLQGEMTGSGSGLGLL